MYLQTMNLTVCVQTVMNIFTFQSKRELDPTFSDYEMINESLEEGTCNATFTRKRKKGRLHKQRSNHILFCVCFAFDCIFFHSHNHHAAYIIDTIMAKTQRRMFVSRRPTPLPPLNIIEDSAVTLPLTMTKRRIGEL